MTNEQNTINRAILKELVAIAGKPNKVISIGRGLHTERMYVWRKTTKGRRAYDWHVLLVTADKARDFNCDVFLCRTWTETDYWRNKRVYPCPERLANAIAVFMPV